METSNVIIHVRFAPNGTVVEIGERPAALNPQQWFDYLSEKIGADAYQTFSGGRGVFRATRDVVDALKAESAAQAA
jgi:hypothetical protein